MTRSWTDFGNPEDRKDDSPPPSTRVVFTDVPVVKEKTANIVASANSGMEKAKAIADETVARMSANNETDKQMAAQRREQRIHEAERKKQEIYEQNAAARQASYSTGAPHSYSTTEEAGQSTGTHQMSALPGHGTGEPMGQVIEGVAESHPIGTATGTQRSSTAHNTHVAGDANKGHGTGGAYTG